MPQPTELPRRFQFRQFQPEIPPAGGKKVGETLTINLGVTMFGKTTRTQDVAKQNAEAADANSADAEKAAAENPTKTATVAGATGTEAEKQSNAADTTGAKPVITDVDDAHHQRIAESGWVALINVTNHIEARHKQNGTMTAELANELGAVRNVLTDFKGWADEHFTNFKGAPDGNAPKKVA